MINIIAALSEKTRAIGKDGALLFSIPQDLARFKSQTTGHPVIMGRKTWESLPEKWRPLPERTNIVVSRDENYIASGALVANSVTQALELAKDTEGADEIWVIGGEQIYELALPFTDCLYLTLVEDDADGDAHFPAFAGFKVIEEGAPEKDAQGRVFRFVTYKRI